MISIGHINGVSTRIPLLEFLPPNRKKLKHIYTIPPQYPNLDLIFQIKSKNINETETNDGKCHGVLNKTPDFPHICVIPIINNIGDKQPNIGLIFHGKNMNRHIPATTFCIVGLVIKTSLCLISHKVIKINNKRNTTTLEPP